MATDEKQWKLVGNSTTSPTDNKKRKEVKLEDRYYVIVGFETNYPSAFLDETQDLAIDYGHAFFYAVRNNIVQFSFSFGPSGFGKVGWFDSGERLRGSPNKYDSGAVVKNGMQNSRPGTSDYPITEPIKAFKITLTKKQAEALEKETSAVREKITSGKQKYTAYMNDTCAETAREILSDSGIKTPGAAGKVKHSGMLSFPIAYADTPYKWHHSFKEAGYKELKFKPPTKIWNPEIGKIDPLFNTEMSDK